MKARRGDQVLVERLGVEAERSHRPRHDPGPAGRQVGVARIAAPDVRAERAANAVRVRAIREGVEVAGDAAAFDRFVGRAHQGHAVPVAADHRVGDPLARGGVAAGAAIDELPEAVHVLAQLAQTR